MGSGLVNASFLFDAQQSHTQVSCSVLKKILATAARASVPRDSRVETTLAFEVAYALVNAQHL